MASGGSDRNSGVRWHSRDFWRGFFFKLVHRDPLTLAGVAAMLIAALGLLVRIHTGAAGDVRGSDTTALRDE